MSGPALAVAIYDVVSDARRTRLHNLLREYGSPVQRSAFEARLTSDERRALLGQVERLIDPKEDSFILYGVSKDQEERIAALGIPRPPVDAPHFFIV